MTSEEFGTSDLLAGIGLVAFLIFVFSAAIFNVMVVIPRAAQRCEEVCEEYNATFQEHKAANVDECWCKGDGGLFIVRIFFK